MAEVEPDDAVVQYQWYADGEAIDGAGEATLLVTDDMVGKLISVTVIAEDLEEATAICTEAVGKYDKLEILSAEQIKKDQVKVTFSAPISRLDEIEVFKGSAEKTVSAVLPDDDNLGATLTMKDALATGTYTVVLTPADTKVDPSSVTFEAKVANKAARIEILGDYLVMKDTNFNEGYCFIKGYNEFNEPITLSGLTVTAAPSDSTQYDASTGKLTVKSNTTNQYAIIKQVTVYAQAMVDSKPVMDQKTLEVANIGYPAEVEFGEITKDSTTVPDISEGITINELNSGLYYIPILSVKDNYGNDMLAKDLNDLNEKNLLTTVPTGDTSLYFSVRAKGSVFTEKNGKIVVFLEKGNGKPGKFNFLMTSAGGQFDKEVNIIENPYIDTLNINLPDIYEYEETDEFGLTAYDQGGNELDLYDYLQAGEYDNGKLPFFDQQNLTESSTYIDAGDNGTWRVQKFADTKTYKVTFVPKETVKSKSIITFVSTTASFKTQTLIATVGARGTSGYIGTELKNPASGEYDFNQNLRFFDANGKEMDRAHNAKYPTFVTPGKKVVATLNKDAVKALTDEKIAEANHDGDARNDFKFYYVVSNTDKVVVTGETETVEQIDGYGDDDGKVKGPNQFYVFLIASQNLDNATQTRIIDSRAFYVSDKQNGDIPVSYTAKVNNKLYTGSKYDDDVAVTVDVTYRNGVVKTGLAATGLSLNGGFKVTDKNKISKGTATGDGTATVSVYLAKVDGLDEKGDPKTYYNDGAVATCTLTYSDDDPVGTSVTFKRETQDPDGVKTYGTSWKEDETESVWDLKENVDSAITVKNGALTMTNGNVAGDKYTVTVNDQYGTPMGDAKYYINGTQVPTTKDTVKADDTAAKVLEIKAQSKGSEVSKTWRVNVPKETAVTAVDNSDYRGSKNVTTAKGLEVALADAGIKDIVVTDDVTLADNITVAKGKTLTIAEGAKVDGDRTIKVLGTLTVDGTLGVDGASPTNGIGALTIGSDDVDAKGNPVNEAKLVVNGEMYTDDAVTIYKGSNLNVPAGGIWAHTSSDATAVTNDGLVDGAGHVEIAGAKVTTTNPGANGDGVWNVTGHTLVFKNVTFGGAAPLLGGHIKFVGDVKCTAAVPVVEGGAKVDISGVTGANTKFVVPGKSSVTVVTKDGDTTEETTITGEDKVAMTVPATSQGELGTTANKLAPTTNALKIQKDSAQGFDFSKYYTDFADSQFVKADKEEVSEDGLTTTYHYTFTGTLNYNEKLPAFEDGPQHWGIAFSAQVGDASSDVFLGPNASEGSTTPIDGWVPAKDSDPILAWGYKTQPSASSSNIIIKYVFTDGTTVLHVVNMSGATFGAAKEATAESSGD